MAYDNNGGADNALRYFNNLKQERYNSMMKAQQGGEEKTSPYGAIIAPNGDMAIPMSTGYKKSYKDMTRKERNAEADRLGIKKISKKYRK
jgi:hypothetical protein